MDSDTTSDTLSSDTDTSFTLSEPELPSDSSFTSGQELDDAALIKTPTMSAINKQTDCDKTPTQASVLKYRPPLKEQLEKFASVSRRLFIVPPTARETHGSLSDDSSGLKKNLSHTRPSIYLLNAAVEKRESKSAIIRRIGDTTDWTQQLPMTVLRRIFVFYICFQQASLHPVNKPYVVPSPTSGPLLLSQICEYWRDTALSTPLLWGSLSVGNNQPDIALLQSWISRSRHTPLALRLKLNLNPTNADYVGAVINLFSRHRERWQILDLRLNDVLANRLRTILAVSSTLPIRSIRLDTKLCSVPVISKMFSVLDRFPSLQEIIYANFNRNSFLSNTIRGSPLWSQLTCIDLGVTLSQFDCIFFLSQCTSATSITFQNIYTFEDEDMPPSTIHIYLYHLQQLDIVASTVDICSTILSHLTCPSLSALSIVTVSNTSESPAHLGAFLIRSACPLHLLNIFDETIDIHTLPLFIRAITTSGAGVGSRKRKIKTLGIYSTKMPRKRHDFYPALRDEEESNGSLGIGIDRIDYWAFLNPDGLIFRTRVGWGKRPAYL
jgi:hypothetical protein